jgi:hypothetical protein
MLAIQPQVGTKDRVLVRIGETSRLRTLLGKAPCLKAECFLDGELAVRDRALEADAASV